MRKIFLYGPPGSGKSTVGKILARNLNLHFVDLDDQIEMDAGKSISQIIAEKGGLAFREMESALIRRVCNITVNEGFDVSPVIVALGGGSLLRDENRAYCESVGEVVFLETTIPVLLSRLLNDCNKRPLLGENLESNLIRLIEQRKEHYSSFKLRVATAKVKNQFTNHLDNSFIRTPEQISWDIQQQLGHYHVRGMGQGYDVIVKSGGLTQLGPMLKERGLGGPVAIVSDKNIASYYSETAINSLVDAGFASSLLVIPTGEENKTLETVAHLWKEFLAIGLDRKSSVAIWRVLRPRLLCVAVHGW